MKVNKLASEIRIFDSKKAYINVVFWIIKYKIFLQYINSDQNKNQTKLLIKTKLR